MTDKEIIAFWGYPNPEIINQTKSEYPNAEWVDVDIDYGYKNRGILPDSYCKIIKNIINNSIELNPLKIVAPIGKDKCDSGWFAAKVLKDMGYNIQESVFEDVVPKLEIKIATSDLPLFEKFNKITSNIINRDNRTIYNQTKPKFGFWGVPPNDMEILRLFPDETHVYGWTRCVEAGTPADIDLEMYVDKNVPTVFYAQAFCSKTQLAKYLADKYNGLYIDIDDYANNSIKAKIEAFLRLR